MALLFLASFSSYAAAHQYPKPDAHTLRKIRAAYPELFKNKGIYPGRYSFKYITSAKAHWIENYAQSPKFLNGGSDAVSDELVGYLINDFYLDPFHTKYFRLYKYVLPVQLFEKYTISTDWIEAAKEYHTALKEAISVSYSISQLTASERYEAMRGQGLEEKRVRFVREVRTALEEGLKHPELSSTISYLMGKGSRYIYSNIQDNMESDLKTLEAMSATTDESLSKRGVDPTTIHIIQDCREMDTTRERAFYAWVETVISSTENLDTLVNNFPELPTTLRYLDALEAYDNCEVTVADNQKIIKDKKNRFILASTNNIGVAVRRRELALKGGNQAVLAGLLPQLAYGWDPEESWTKSLTTDQSEKSRVLSLLERLQKRYGEGTPQAMAFKEETAENEIWVSDAAPHLWKAEKFRRKGDDNGCDGGSCARAALAEYQKAIEAEPLDWRGWDRFAQAEEEIGGSILVAANAYDKALSLISRCAGHISSVCTKITDDDHNRIRFSAARLHLQVAHYSRAAELYREGLKSRKKEGPAQWGAVARFAAEDYQAARAQYHATAEDPSQYDQKGEFEVMLRSGFIKLSEKSEKKGRLWDAYAHEQNIARIEAAADILQRPKPYTTSKLIKLYNSLTWRHRTWRGFDGTRISPEMSSYGRAQAKAAYDFARRGKYYKSRRSFRLALATDPWWVKGASALAYVDLMVTGLCDAIPEAEKAIDLLKQVKIDPASAINIEIPLQRSLDEWRRQKNYADRNAADYDPGYCDPDPDLPHRSIIHPDREILIAPK